MSTQNTNWAFVENFSWDSTQEERYQSIRPLHVIPVAKGEETENFVISRRIQQGVAELQRFVSNLVASAAQSKGKGFRILDIPVVVVPECRLFMLDYTRVKLTVHDTYRPYDVTANTFGTEHLSWNAVGGIKQTSHWRLCGANEVARIFGNFTINDWGTRNQKLNKDNGITCVSISRTQYYIPEQKCIGAFNGSDHLISADIYVFDIPEGRTWLECLLDWNWTPEKAGNNSPAWESLKYLWANHMIEVTGAEKGEPTIRAKDELLEAARSGKLDHIGSVSLQGEITGSEALFRKAKERLLNCDTVRADISPYDERQLEDPIRGSWELWEPDTETNRIMSVPSVVYARDPRQDIVDGGVVGIDFGTKSTVVVCLEGSDRIQPMRIGSGNYEQALSAADYENPTVMECINLERFLDAYNACRGRPLTRWDDLPISHTAFDDWNKISEAGRFSSFLSSLKQWAGSPKQGIRLRDQQEREWSLPPYLQLHDSDPDPIELYAYYIGLYINNMHRGHGQIFMEYLLSFPVTYAKTVREHILASFRRGITKSLPMAVLSDESCMEQFSVRQGVGEPAAYAACALQEYGFRPRENEQISYAIFDFGGGTADFDFGTWARAPKPSRGRSRWDYVIHHFGDGGDRFLGGENLLEMLAFHVFRRNQGTLREKRITFPCPPHCEPFPGSDALLSESQTAHTNMRILMEELRPLWENTEEELARTDGGRSALDLFPKDAREDTEREAVELIIDKQELVGLLRQRIDRGIAQFFAALYKAFGRDRVLKGELGRIYIFLAGNSSKSPILWQAFQTRIGAVSAEIRKAASEGAAPTEEAAPAEEIDTLAEDVASEGEIDEQYFMLCPPLGTEAAWAKMEELGVEPSEDEYTERPNGKTGVAFGLVQCRTGSRIKVEQEAQDENNEIRFRCWVGAQDADGCFDPVLRRDTAYQKWVEYIDAGDAFFEFYCTTLPAADQPGALPIRETKRFRKQIPKSAQNVDWNIYLRATGPLELEYTVARSQEDADVGRFQCDPVKITLQL